jgi:hypothetical protein
VPPYGFKDEEGVRDETPILTLMLVAEEAIGIIPDGSVTMGAHEPATAVTWQVIVVGAVTEMLKQSMFENLTLFTVVGMLVPVIVKVVPE